MENVDEMNDIITLPTIPSHYEPNESTVEYDAKSNQYYLAIRERIPVPGSRVETFITGRLIGWERLSPAEALSYLRKDSIIQISQALAKEDPLHENVI